MKTAFRCVAFAAAAVASGGVDVSCTFNVRIDVEALLTLVKVAVFMATLAYGERTRRKGCRKK